MNSFAIVVVLGVLALCGTSLAQVGAPCHNRVFTFTPRHSLNLTAFSGTWFAQEYASSFIGNTPEPDYKCLRINFVQEDALHFTTHESFTNLTDGTYHTDESFITVNATRSPLNAVWTQTSAAPWVADMVLLSADLQFSRWAVLYSCAIRPENFRWETVMILTRDRNIDDELRNFVKALTVGTGFRIADHWPIYQTGCLA